MKFFQDHEFTLVTPQSATECEETLRQLALYAELTGCTVKKKKGKDAPADGRHFAYKYRGKFTTLEVTGNIEPYERPYSGCRVPVCVSDGAPDNVGNLFICCLIIPLGIMGCLVDGEYDGAAVLAVLFALMVGKWIFIDMRAMKKSQELLAQIFRATVEPEKQEHPADA